MLQDELIELANQVRHIKAEVQIVEVKAAHEGCPKKLYDTLSSFSNQDSGGILLFGLDEKQNFAVVGVYNLQDLQKKVTEQCNQMMPPVRAVFTAAELEGKIICSAEIPSVDLAERPCYYSGVGRVKGSYIRVGDADLPMTDYEIYTYEAFRSHVHDDERVVDRATSSLMDQNKVNAYVSRMTEERPGFSKLSDEQVNEMLAITRGSVPTLAAILNFGLYPQGYFPQLAITAIVVPGKEIGDTSQRGERFLNNKRIEGTLPEMLTEALAFCTRNMKVRTIIDPNTGERADRTEYPIEAIREAVLNALIHRDYSHFTEGTPVQIDFFENRLEIHSPGGLYGRMTIEDLGKARPDLRNPALATMSEFLLKTENRYSGIPTIRREMREARLPEPVFQNHRNEFVVILYNDRLNEESDTMAEQKNKDLLLFCSIPRSRQEITEYLGIGTVFYAMKHYVQPLLESGDLIMTIPDKPKSRNQKFVSARKE
ncbi:MAG: putative DNA binding domain-containing protein [Blautia sp.]|nr:putative DNA binding domain-containing protein [Blautia sp.]